MVASPQLLVLPETAEEPAAAPAAEEAAEEVTLTTLPPELLVKIALDLVGRKDAPSLRGCIHFLLACRASHAALKPYTPLLCHRLAVGLFARASSNGLWRWDGLTDADCCALGAYEPELKSLPPHDALPAALTAPPPHDALPGDRRLELPDPSDARYLTVASRRLSDAALRGLNLQRHDKLVSLHVGGDWRSHSSRGCSSLRDTTPLAKALPAFRTLTALELPRNAIDDAGFLPLCEAIASLPLRLERLRFDANRLGDASAAALAAAAPLASLSVLALAHNCIGCAGAEALAAAGQLELIELNLAANEVGTRGALALTRRLGATDRRGLRIAMWGAVHSLVLEKNPYEEQALRDALRDDRLKIPQPAVIGQL